MSIHPKVSERDLINLRELAEQQKNQRAIKIKKNIILKPAHDVKLAESLSPITKKLDRVNEPTQKLGKIVEKSEVEDGHSQTSAMENTTNSQSLRDTLSFMKTSENFFKLEQKDGGKVLWKNNPYQSKRRKQNSY